MAKKTRSGVMGVSVMRMPMASWMAFRIAGVVGMVAGSATPLAPNGPRGSGTSTISHSMSGTSMAVGTR